MLMFLTRLGHDTKMIVTGDASRSTCPTDTRSGLVDAVEKLRGIKGIGLVELETRRHRPAPAGAEHRQRVRAER